MLSLRAILAMPVPAALWLAVLCAVFAGSTRPAPADDSAEAVVEAIYPRFGGTWVGDPMPFYDEGRLEIFYLNDQRVRRARAYHPWHRASTTDLIRYRDHGEALAVEDALRSRDRALGTGSVIKAHGGYYAFYTGHNRRLSPVEMVMTATSPDKITWTKHPELALAPPAGYSRHSFRDPHVLYMAERDEYWMLVTTRRGGDGVIARFVSDDLRGWRDAGVLFANDEGDGDANLEVPALFERNGYWYLVFSDQHPDRTTQYRIADSPEGPFRRPPSPAFDGRGFYAGKPALMGERLILAGWTPTKAALRDQREFMWAGNLVIHELLQDDDGSLRTVAPAEIAAAFGDPKPPELAELAEQVELPGLVADGGSSPVEGEFVFEGAGWRIESFAPIEAATRISGRIAISKPGRFGFAFNVEDGRSDRLVVFDSKTARLLYYNVPPRRFWSFEPQAALDYDMAASIDFDIYIDGSVLVLYVDKRKAFSTRIHEMPGGRWGVFSLDAGVSFSGLGVSRRRP